MKEKVVAVIFAGGIGQRMYSKSKPKQFLELHNKPIIIHTLEKFSYNDQVDAIVIACLEEWIPYMKDLIHRYNVKKVEKIVCGGKNGQGSIYNGLCAAKEVAEGSPAIVMIHDGVRPFINDQVIADNIRTVKESGSAITTGEVKETILVVGNNGSTDYITDRSKSRVAKAPQSFWLKDILGAHERAIAEGKLDFIDSCTMMHHYGFSLQLVDGPNQNIKITTPEDFYTMRAMLDAKENAQIYGYQE